MTPTLPANGAERGEETRTALLRAGRRLFASRGFDGASVREITREAEANLGAVTYHFGSKRALYQEVLAEGLSPLVDRVGAAAEGEGAPLDRLEAVVDVFFDHLAANPDLPHLLLQEVAAGKAPPPEVVAILRRNAGHIGRILTQGHDDGTVRRGHPMLSAISVASQPLYMTLVAPLLRDVGGVDLRHPATRRMAADHVKAFVRAGLESREESHP
jgi:AcrR family transcriptional regulator